MPNIERVRVELNGPAFVGPSVSTFYCAEGTVDTVVPALVDLYEALGTYMPNGSGMGILPTGDVLDAATGALVGAWTVSGTPGAGFSGDVVFAAGVGVRIRWTTEGFALGHRVVGSTFLVPLTSSVYDDDGTINTGPVNGMQDAVDTFLTTVGTDLRIWTRPKGGSGGGVSTVVGGTVVDKISWLRSRRT